MVKFLKFFKLLLLIFILFIIPSIVLIYFFVAKGNINCICLALLICSWIISSIVFYVFIKYCFSKKDSPCPEISEINDEIYNKKYAKQISEVFMSLAHDIKNPLTVIGGYANTMLQYYNDFDDEKKKEFLRRIELESGRLSRMLKDYLNTLSHGDNIDNLNFKKVNIKNILHYFYNIYEGQAKEENIKFIIETDENIPEVKADESKLEFVISNLLSNAFKFVPNNGEIIIRSKASDEYVFVSVSNTYNKNSEVKEKMIFEKFQKVNDSIINIEGNGLGLYIAKTIIERHNGYIGVNNDDENKAITFYFNIPLNIMDKK